MITMSWNIFETEPILLYFILLKSYICNNLIKYFRILSWALRALKLRLDREVSALLVISFAFRVRWRQVYLAKRASADSRLTYQLEIWNFLVHPISACMQKSVSEFIKWRSVLETPSISVSADRFCNSNCHCLAGMFVFPSMFRLYLFAYSPIDPWLTRD